ncbi:oligosaccharide flippase family protein [Nocardioides bizhenqiangii]|uniref:Polysaccharide biosynthesis C-terminal domain-containing protein n=1 Tax=Nocardioides bizhenqiangii TaxID=3095076 RepID=A0ABZ0ZMU4_9ACTN|nr:polysaccharide biosynthesis C-terminal domain-containing protein [Nocardioides sp. HM61]WQQ25632.1 polysaccharide biosynthesis C-terminal domain-containing protein [Nocardioides sp. HM61]
MSTKQGTGSLAVDGRRTIAGAVISNAATFLVALLIARLSGEALLGAFAILFALRAILALVCGLGMRIAMTKFVAASRARGDYASLRGAVRLGVGVPVGAAVLAGIGLALLAPVLAEQVFGAASMTGPMRVVAVSLPFAVLMDVTLAATQGFRSMRAFARIGLILEPLCRLGFAAVSLVAGWGLMGLAGGLLAASVIGGTSGAVVLSRRIRDLPDARPVYPWRNLARFAGVSWVASMATQGILWVDVVLLGAMVAAAEVGVYQVATRAVMACMIVITPLTASMAPRIAHHWETRELEQVSDDYGFVVRWTWRLTIVPLTVVFGAPAAVLACFGPGFSDGVIVILILGAGALVEALAAPSAVLLNQTGHNRLNMRINLSALVGNILLNLALIPVYGIAGAAVAWLVTLLFSGLVRIAVVRHLVTHEWPLRRPHLVSAGAALLALVLIRLMTATTALDALVTLALAAGIVVLVYPAVVLRSGLVKDERKAARSLLVRARRELSVRVPVLRRWVNRWRVRRLRPGAEPIPVDQLISPHRSDILARKAVFDLAAEHRDILDSEEFFELASQSLYGTWFRKIVVPGLGLAGVSEQEQVTLFRQAVSRVAHLFTSFEANGFDTQHPITVARIPAGTKIAGRSLAEDRWVPVDGCHRLALLVRSGLSHIPVDHYVIDPDGDCRHNTARMSEALERTESEVVAFLARGLCRPGNAVTTWDELLDALELPANRAHLEDWPEAQRYSRAVSVSP